MQKRLLTLVIGIAVSTGCSKSSTESGAVGRATANDAAATIAQEPGSLVHERYAEQTDRYQGEADRYLDESQQALDQGAQRLEEGVHAATQEAADSIERTRVDLLKRAHNRTDGAADYAAEQLKKARSKVDAAEAEIQNKTKSLRGGLDRLENAIEGLRGQEPEKPSP